MQMQFDASQHKPSDGQLEPVPAGYYNVQITDSEQQNTKNNDGYFLKMTFTIIDGAHQGHPIIENFNIGNKNPKTVQIAMSDISAICKAINIGGFNNTQELHGKTLSIKVAVKSNDGTDYGPQNVIKKYEAASGNAGNNNGGYTPPQQNQQQFNQQQQNGGFNQQQNQQQNDNQQQQQNQPQDYNQQQNNGGFTPPQQQQQFQQNDNQQQQNTQQQQQTQQPQQQQQQSGQPSWATGQNNQ